MSDLEDEPFKANSVLSYQKKSSLECQYDGRKTYVGTMSICQNATFKLRYQNESCSECHKDVRQSVCQYVRIQLFSLGIKIKVVQNIIMMSHSMKTAIWTAKEQDTGKQLYGHLKNRILLYCYTDS